MEKNRKVLLLIIGIIIFQLIIYCIGEYCGYRAHLLTTELDNKIPYISWFIYFYISWYLLLFIVPYVIYINDKISFLKYLSSVIVSLLITLLIFIAYPTVMTRTPIITNTFNDFLVEFIYNVSTPTKCIPSLHVVFATSFMLYTLGSKNLNKLYKINIVIISIGIILSTLFIKQHMIYDVISGILVVVISWLLVNKLNLYKYLDKVVF